MFAESQNFSLVQSELDNIFFQELEVVAEETPIGKYIKMIYLLNKK